MRLPELSQPRNNVLAACCTEPYHQFPSHVTLTPDKPSRSEKLYLLTANLVKTVKCYYPAVKVGEVSAGGNPVPDRGCYLALIDVVLDATRSVESFEFRCVTTESLFGILGATMLEAD